jgi:hypothetical protein
MSIARRAAALGAVLTGALAGPASADTFCVATSDCPGGVEVPGLATALLSAEANPGADTIRLGNATFIGPYSYAAPDPLVIEGSEHSALRSNGEGQTVLGLDGPAVVSNVQVRLEHDHTTGLELDGTAVAEGVEVGHLLGPAAELTGVLMGTGTLADSHVTVPASGLSTGVTTTGGLVVIRDSVIEGSRGIWGPFNPFSSSVRRVHVRASSGIGIQRGTVAIEDALVEHNGTGDGGGIAAFGTSHPTHVTVRQSTVVGAGPAALAGVAAISNLEAATVDLRDSIVTAGSARCSARRPAATPTSPSRTRTSPPRRSTRRWAERAPSPPSTSSRERPASRPATGWRRVRPSSTLAPRRRTG